MFQFQHTVITNDNPLPSRLKATTKRKLPVLANTERLSLAVDVVLNLRPPQNINTLITCHADLYGLVDAMMAKPPKPIWEGIFQGGKPEVVALPSFDDGQPRLAYGCMVKMLLFRFEGQGYMAASEIEADMWDVQVRAEPLLEFFRAYSWDGMLQFYMGQPMQQYWPIWFRKQIARSSIRPKMLVRTVAPRNL